MTLSDALRFAPSTAGPGVSLWDVPDGWQQGRGAFGGLTLAALAKAGAAALGASDRPLRTITAEIPAAVLLGQARLHASVLRSGSGLATARVELRQGDSAEVAAHAVLNFGKTRPVDFDRAGSTATFPPFDGAPEGGPAATPVFLQHFELRIVRGEPLAGDLQAATEGWVRLREPGDVEPSLALVAMIDAWFPSVLPVLAAWRPFGTIAFAAHLFDRGWSPRQPLFHRSRLLASQDGYFAELRELFSADGQLCAVNQQTMAIIK